MGLSLIGAHELAFEFSKE